MKIYIFAIIPLMLMVFMSSCDDEKSKEVLDDASISKDLTDDELYEFEAFSLKPYGINAMIYLPDETASIGASTQPRIEHEEDGFKWNLSIGSNFNIRIDDWGKEDMIKLHKEELEAYSKYYNIEFIEDTPTFISYKKDLKVKGIDGVDDNVGVEHTTYHCYGQTTIEGINYVFRSLDNGNPMPILEYMSTSVKSVKPIETQAVN